VTTNAEHLAHIEALCYAIEKYTDRPKFDQMHLNLDGISEAIKDIPPHRYSKRERRALEDFKSYWAPKMAC